MAEQGQYFHNGKYYNSIRAAYQDLLHMGVSILGIKAIQLRKTTFSYYMFFEGWYAIQIHFLDELSNSILLIYLFALYL